MYDTILFFEPTDHKILYLIPSIFSLGNSKLFTLDGKKKISQFFFNRRPWQGIIYKWPNGETRIPANVL